MRATVSAKEFVEWAYETHAANLQRRGLGDVLGGDSGLRVAIGGIGGDGWP